MKKSAALMMSAIMLTGILTGCGAETEVETEAETEKQTAAETTVTTTKLEPGYDAAYDGCSMRIDRIKSTWGYGSNGFWYLAIITMTIKNNSDETKYFDGVFSMDIKQQGKSCRSVTLDKDDFQEAGYDTSTSYFEVKPGMEYTVYKAYDLYELYESEAITLTVKGYNDPNNKVLLSLKAGGKSVNEQ